MTVNALDTTINYFTAWTGGDFDKALQYVSGDVVCKGPAGVITGTEAFRAFMGPFAGSLVSAELLAAFGDEHSALIMYDASTQLVDNAPGAELHTVVDGVITVITIIFDRQPFVEARARVHDHRAE